MVSDNGPQIVAKSLTNFFKLNGVKHILTSPFHPRSNGAAEIAVKIFKEKIKTAISDPKNAQIPITTLISRFLLVHRSTEHTSTGKTPASLMFGREIRTRLQILREEDDKLDRETGNQEQERETSHTVETKARCKKFYGGRRREFKQGEDVLVRDYRNVNQKSWTRGRIMKRIVRTTYLCKLPTGKTWKRHANQIRTYIGTESSSDCQTTRSTDSYNINSNFQKHDHCNNYDNSDYFINLP